MKRCAKNSEGVKEVLAKTLLEAAGTLFLIYMLIHEQDLIDFEIRVGEKMRYRSGRHIKMPPRKTFKLGGVLLALLACL